MKTLIKYLMIFFILIWSVSYKAKSEDTAIYTISNGRIVPLKHTSAASDQYYGRSTNSKVYFNRIIVDKYGKELK